MLWRVSRLLDPVEQGGVSNESFQRKNMHILELLVPGDVVMCGAGGNIYRGCYTNKWTKDVGYSRLVNTVPFGAVLASFIPMTVREGVLSSIQSKVGVPFGHNKSS